MFDREGNELNIGDKVQVDCNWDKGMIKRHGECQHNHFAEIVEDKYLHEAVFKPRQHFSVSNSKHIVKISND